MSKNFKQLTELYKRMDLKEDPHIGSLLLKNQLDCDLLNELLSNPEEYGIELKEGSVLPEDIVTLYIDPPRIGMGTLYDDYAALFHPQKNLYKEPPNYYIKEVKFFSGDHDIPKLIANYRAVLSFFSLLKESSAYFDESSYEIVFFDSELFKISINYSYCTIQELNKDDLDSLMLCFDDDTHREQKLSILIKSMQTITENVQPASIFEYILNNIRLLRFQFDKGYRVFVSAFSYDKVMDQLRIAKVEEMGKIHKVFSDIQNQILGIPVATIIISTQMKPTKSWDYQAIINSSVLFGCLIFVCLVMLMLFNQLQTLKTIKEEIDHRKKQIKKEYSSIEGDISGVFSSISNRLLIQSIAFYIILMILVFGLMLTSFVYCYLTGPIWEYIYPIIHILSENYITN
ncbi:hypothetical protein HGO23_06770 [Xenorhabdus budapestensis]|uniref:Phage-related membrane protein n=1 Tax=Xenorhabdus budapestensis TaxID=290110 RepID=A0ABX7VJR3_XENBU|nr:hypothetical protein [Xenorhabdus budapestensis]QTL41034.1 hypothetical protein HGO23_06770 [Xenorhabdus budapestensis]